MFKDVFSWRYIRWAIAIPSLPIALWACTSHPLSAPRPQPEQTSEMKVIVNPTRMVDMIFMIDNSASMAPKQKKLAEQFPKLINALEDPNATPKLPDMRIAILSSDVGTGSSGTCTPQFGDRGQFQMINPQGQNCGQNNGAKWLTNNPTNFSGGDIAKVFGCLAQGVGQSGCGFEQQLQSINYAFIVDQQDDAGKPIGVAVKDFIRDNAYLAIVLLTDEDDCSTPLNSLLAQNNLSTTESWSLRCATRGHSCSGNNLSYPTTEKFVTDYANCSPRTDYCPQNETAQNPTSCTPLANIDDIVKNIKDYKRAKGGTEDLILVAGIFGKPLEGQTQAKYRIDKTPNPTDGQPDIYDYWPICYDPTLPGPLGEDGAFKKDAAGLGAYGGLRIQSFLDKFPKENSLAFSICETDFGPAMSQIGDVLRRRLSSLCVPKKLMDTDLNQDGVQPDCEVHDVVGTRDLGKVEWCGSNGNQRPCWRVEAKPDECPVRNTVPSQHIVVDRPANETMEPNQSVKMACRTCVELKPGLNPDQYQVDGCRY
jgi:hypothetical protein